MAQSLQFARAYPGRVRPTGIQFRSGRAIGQQSGGCHPVRSQVESSLVSAGVRRGVGEAAGTPACPRDRHRGGSGHVCDVSVQRAVMRDKGRQGAWYGPAPGDLRGPGADGLQLTSLVLGCSGVPHTRFELVSQRLK